MSDAVSTEESKTTIPNHNVVQLFPHLTKEGRPALDIEKVKNTFFEIKKEINDDMATVSCNIVLDCLADGGYDFGDLEDNKYTKDFTLVLESVKSLLYKFSSIDHPLQDFADEIFIVKEPGVVLYVEKSNEDTES